MFISGSRFFDLRTFKKKKRYGALIKTTKIASLCTLHRYTSIKYFLNDVSGKVEACVSRFLSLHISYLKLCHRFWHIMILMWDYCACACAPSKPLFVCLLYCLVHLLLNKAYSAVSMYRRQIYRLVWWLKLACSLNIFF